MQKYLHGDIGAAHLTSWWSNRLHLPKQPVFDEGGVTRAVLFCLPFLEAQPAHTGEISENPEMLGSALP